MFFNHSVQPYFMASRKKVIRNFLSSGVQFNFLDLFYFLKRHKIKKTISLPYYGTIFENKSSGTILEIDPLINSLNYRTAFLFTTVKTLPLLITIVAWLRVSFFSSRVFSLKCSSYQVARKSGKAQKKFTFLIYRTSKTNSYVSVTDNAGGVLYSVTAGSIGIKKRWERHIVPTFIKLINLAFEFIKKNKPKLAIVCQFSNYNMPYVYSVHSRAIKFNLRIRSYHFVPTLIHGGFLRKKRIKRL